MLAQQTATARGPLERVLSRPSPHHKEVLLWLGEAYLSDPKLAKSRGVQYMDSLLAMPDLESKERQQALALKAQLLLAEDQLDLAWEIWTQFPTDAPLRFDVQLALGHYFLRLAERRALTKSSDTEIEAAYQQAVDVLNEGNSLLVGDAGPERGHLLFLRGQAEKGIGRDDLAIENFTYVRRQFFDQPIGIAAGFWEAQCMLESDKFDDAFRLFISLLRETIRPNNQGDSPWLNETSLTKMVETAIDRYLLLNDCQSAVNLADEFRVVSRNRIPAIPLGYAASFRVRALRKWVSILESQMATRSFAERTALEPELLGKYADLAHSLYSLAVNRYATESYTDDLFQAGEFFYLARDYRRTVLTMQQYLDSNDSKFAAMARLRMGQSQQAQRQFATAIEALTQCWVLYPNDPVIYQARFQAAECHLELGQAEQAQERLRANLDNDKLTPSSQEWIASLYLYGFLLFDEAKKLEARSRLAETNTNRSVIDDHVALMKEAATYYGQAINRLSEAIQRAPQSADALEGLYRLAEAYQRQNRWHETEIKLTTIAARKVQINERIRRNDQQAITLLGTLEERLIELREQQPLNAIQERLLRNSYFTRGHLHTRLGQFEAAIHMYRTVSNMVIQEPEVLEAYVGIAGCYRRLNQNDQAIRVINQAKVILRDRIAPGADFEATTRFSRDRWITMLDWLATI
jgi:tetratricopeptide (TPR) repeat protein